MSGEESSAEKRIKAIKEDIEEKQAKKKIIDSRDFCCFLRKGHIYNRRGEKVFNCAVLLD